MIVHKVYSLWPASIILEHKYTHIRKLKTTVLTFDEENEQVKNSDNHQICTIYNLNYILVLPAKIIFYSSVEDNIPSHLLVLPTVF